jgi:hypothetical protein
MTTSAGNSMEALEALLAERGKYERWLAQLDARRASTPSHVFERVHGDYAARLTAVTEQLTSRATELESTATTLAEQIKSLFDSASTRRDERAEAELRAAVGEFSDEEAGAIFARCDAEIDSLEGRRTTLSAELARVQEVLAESARPAAIPDPRGATPPAAPAIPVEPEIVAQPATPVMAEPVAAEPYTSEPVVSQAPSAAVEPPAAPRAPSPTPSAPEPAGAGVFDDLAFLQSLVEPRAGRAPEPAELAPAPAPRAERQTVPPSAPAERDGFVVPPSLAANRQQSAASRDAMAPLQPTLTPGSLPAFIKEMPTEQIKTLKCQECGTMNYPTEWYCERCGGELAAM